MSHPVQEKRDEAMNRYLAGFKKIEAIVKSNTANVTLEDLENLSGAVEETRLALKDVQLWDGVIKTGKES